MIRNPIGVMPQFLWDELRMKDLNDAIERYNEAGIDFPVEWEQELLELKARYW